MVINNSKNRTDLLYKIMNHMGSSKDISDLLSKISNSLVRYYKMNYCFIYFINSSSHNIKLLSAYPNLKNINNFYLEPKFTSLTLKLTKPIFISKNAYKDTRFETYKTLINKNCDSIFSIPLIDDGNIIGVIDLLSHKLKLINPEDKKILSIIAKVIARFIKNISTSQKSFIKAEQIETITKLSKSIVSNLYLNEILHLIVTMTANMMNSKICSLMLVDNKTETLSIVATQSLSENYIKKPPIKINQSLSGKSILEKRPIAVLDVTKDPNYSYPEIAKQEGLCSMLAVPMFFKDRPIGVINCYTTTQHLFSEEEIHIIQIIANQAAIAIENTRLLEEAQRSREELETRKLIERAKGILMREKNIDEETAFRLIQTKAMNMRMTMREIAKAIILTSNLNDDLLNKP